MKIKYNKFTKSFSSGREIVGIICKIVDNKYHYEVHHTDYDEDSPINYKVQFKNKIPKNAGVYNQNKIFLYDPYSSNRTNRGRLESKINDLEFECDNLNRK